MRKIPRFIGIALVFLAALAAAEEIQSADKDSLKERVEKRVQAWQPTKEERRLDDIGWARDLRDALRLAREHNRPVFFFSYDGTADRPQAMALQRC
jgi:hypothetical protein